MTYDATETTRISDLAGLLALVPALVGYEPSESVVVMVLTDQRLAVTMRANLDPRGLSHLVEKALKAARQTGSTDLIVVGYSPTFTQAKRALLVDLALGIENATLDADLPLRVHQLAAVTADGWCEIDPWNPSENPLLRSLDELSNHPARVSRVFMGRSVARSREEVASRVKPHSEEPSTTFSVAAEAMILALPGLSDEEVVAMMNEALDEVERVEVGDVVDEVTLAGLTVMVTHPLARDEAMLRIDRDSAQRFVDVWSRVTRLVDGRVATAALFLTGVCAWQLGDGALMNLCAEAGARIDPEHIGVRVLEAITECAWEPERFEDMKADLRAQRA